MINVNNFLVSSLLRFLKAFCIAKLNTHTGKCTLNINVQINGFL